MSRDRPYLCFLWQARLHQLEPLQQIVQLLLRFEDAEAADGDFAASVDKAGLEMAGDGVEEELPGGFLHRGFEDDVLLAFRLDAGETEAFAQLLEFQDADELFGGEGDSAVAIVEVGGDLGQFPLAVGGGEGAVGAHLLLRVVDVVVGDEGRDLEIDLGVVHLGNLLTANFSDFFLQHVHVEVEADRIHLTGLLDAKQVADTANLHVAHGELVAGTELGELLNGAEALAGFGRKGLLAGVEQPRMGLDARSPHTSPQLIKLGQPELVSIFDQDGVDAGNVQTGLDDGGADEDVRFAAAETEHGGFQFAFLHLAVGDHDAGTGNPFPQTSRHLFNAFDTGHDVEDLATAIEFLTGRTADGFGIVGGEVGFDSATGGGAVW